MVPQIVAFGGGGFSMEAGNPLLDDYVLALARRAHGVDEVLAEAWRRGTILCGPSAGSLCWFAEALTAFHGPPERVEGLGLLPFSNCVHYDAEPERRAVFRRLIDDGMAPGYAA